MKSKLSLVAGAVLALALAGCGQEDPPAGSIGGQGDVATTPPGAASDASGNMADQNTQNAVPTQEQADPIPEANKPGGRIEQQQERGQ